MMAKTNSAISDLQKSTREATGSTIHAQGTEGHDSHEDKPGR